MTLPALEDLLGTAIEGSKASFRLERIVKSWLEVPSKVTLTYIDKDLDHAQNVVNSAIQGEEEKELKVNVPIVMTQTQAKDLADKTLYLERLSRITYGFSLPRTHLKYDPGDILPMLINGVTVNLLITDVAYDPRGMITLKAVENDIDLYDLSTNLPASLPRPPVQRIAPPSTFYNLNIPYLSDADIGMTTALVALDKQNWTGASLFASYDNGITYAPIVPTLTGTRIGTAATILPNAGIDVLDYTSTLQVYPLAGQVGTIEPITILEMLNGKNTILLGDEVLRFADADLQLDGSYILSVFQRGVRGTENHTSTHVADETAYLLDNKTSLSAEVGRPFLIKALSFGSYDTLASVSPVSVSPLGVGLRPYAPCQVTGSRASGDLTINWQRRDRINAEWRGAGEIPMSESIEKYEIDIYNVNTVVRTITVISAKTTVYTSAQQVTDFGSAQSAIKMRLYQISSVVGRGSYIEVTL